MYYPPYVLLLLALVCALVGRTVPFYRVLSILLIALALIAAAFEAHLTASCAIVGVSAIEAQRFRQRFEQAMAGARLSAKEVSILLYGHEDHGRLNHDLENGAIRGVPMDRLPNEFHEVWIELVAEERKLAVATKRSVEQVARLFASVPKPQPASMGEEVCLSA